MELRIYQLNSDKDTDYMMFRDYAFTAKNGGVKEENYDMIYHGLVKANDLEDVYRIFNIDRPNDYKGRSLSVSDVVEVIGGTPFVDPGFYFCDSIGFSKIDFDAEKASVNAEDAITVIVVEPQKTPYKADIGKGLSDMQKIVGGYIEAFYPFDDPVCIVCNEEGKMCGLPLNRAVIGENGETLDIVAGTFFICGIGESDFVSVPEHLMKKYLKLFKKPEAFKCENGKINRIFI